jgi:hypothetical protein
MYVVSIIGALLSAIGAAVAIHQALRVKKYRDEILHDRLKILLFEVMGIAKKAREECRKIITPVGNHVRGVNQQIVVNSIRDCLEKIEDNSHKFSVDGLSEIMSQVDALIGKYTKETDESQRYSLGDQIYKLLGRIISCLTEEIDLQV